SDISDDLLDVCRTLAAGDERAEFVHAGADDLSPVGDESVDVVTTRSVLIYVDDKARAFGEFFRVLRPGGRVSLFEPINSFGYPEPEGVFGGIEMGEVWPLAKRLLDRYSAMADEDTAMVDFDE